VPNYFGAQRFGRQGSNIDLLTQPGARRDRRKRSFGLSALRSAMFNHYLAGRVEARTWLVRNVGEIATRTEPDAGSGLLWGSGENLSGDVAAMEESKFFAQFPASCEILQSYQARMMRRSLRLSVDDLRWHWDADRLTLSFGLSKGSYATSVVHEIGEFQNAPPGES
jgi:tRNA pseudouridine13 synthase